MRILILLIALSALMLTMPQPCRSSHRPAFRFAVPLRADPCVDSRPIPVRPWMWL